MTQYYKKPLDFRNLFLRECSLPWLNIIHVRLFSMQESTLKLAASIDNPFNGVETQAKMDAISVIPSILNPVTSLLTHDRTSY